MPVVSSLPRTLVNPLIKDKVTFLKTAAETNGAYTLVEVELAPGGGNNLHYHVDYIEVFEVVEGTLGVQCGKENFHLQPGETATVPRKAVHRFYNPSQQERVIFHVTIKPARQFEELLRIGYGLATDGKTNQKGVPNIWYLALMFEKGETYFPSIPFWLQRGLVKVFAKIARFLGMDQHLHKYYLERSHN
ncbi:cupin domain-containing protein [Rufibacter latericius]|uniref:Cupin domain-containing protein n=1 Tax=Rufibacter latericius TaxID=2487040 RepID=A0A3M9MT34_9BACT|nr:cupin domain-containing protein [Rufibacter latericius]RNI28686.1 cupin domain-containing protein [Rufibacter latericius]